ncbi:bcl-2 homologous antagonist/killer-like [Dreissena polymorpha]|uniref:Bcl-2 Bcl-2 homology region 1-3 domain-containing protein n=1 Tax=Dreissena polymorpha TaxID=45954 RepID=A0A9D4HZE1_DREPO|nr:bcl-2 homologous antagonist/killer-like [Dreissena polymorpha]XP_052241751.1 bcl-2 homologous antagonist/killer-like [Dreissena polymorpha]KAH3738443.1 hypothetical protein DPMN_045077 [Dreissena polymorpha]
MSDEGLPTLIKEVHGPESVSDEPDSAQRVVSQTRYVFIAYANEQISRDEGQDETFTNAHHQDMSSQNEIINEDALRVGRQLAKVADDMIKQLSATFEVITRPFGDSLNSYENFKEIAKEILKDEVNWGRILVIFCFGYWLFKREIVKQARKKMGTTLGSIASLVEQFFSDPATSIAAWIALRGGWRVAQSVTRSKSHPIMKIGIMVGFVAVAIGVIVVLMNRRKSTP